MKQIKRMISLLLVATLLTGLFAVSAFAAGGPTITTQPKSVRVAVGASTTMKVAASGNGTLRYQWQYRTPTNRTWKSATATGNKTAALKLTATEARSGYQYRCSVKDNNGTTYSNAATLAVGKGPVITVQTGTNVGIAGGGTAPLPMTSIDAEEYDITKITVRAYGSNLTYQWQYRTSSTGAWKNTTATGNKTNTLTVSCTAAKDGYQYRCKISGGGVTVISQPTTLHVIVYADEFYIVSQPVSKRANLGDVVTFHVNANGVSSYQWQYRTPTNRNWSNTSATGSKTDTLTLSATKARNGYQYRCKMIDAFDDVWYTNTVTLAVGKGPVITAQPTSREVLELEDATFTVSAYGSNLSYQWQKYNNGSWENIAPGKTICITGDGSRNGSQYRCVVTDGNGLSTTSRVVTLTVEVYTTDKPVITAQPQSVTVTAGDTAVFQVAADEAGMWFQWEYRTSPTGTWKHATASGNKTDTLRVPATLGRNGYQYRCCVSSEDDCTYSEPATLTVLSDFHIEAQPQNQTNAKVGDVVIYQVAVGGGTAPYTYQWQYIYDGQTEYRDFTDSYTWYSGGKTDTLSITVSDSTFYYHYQYRCLITDANGTVLCTDAVSAIA